EQPNGDYAKTTLGQGLVDAFDLMFYTELSVKKDETLASIAAKSLKEIGYHKRHIFIWVLRFGNVTDESHLSLSEAFADLWQFTGELFEMNEVDAALLKEGVAVDLDGLREKWNKEVAQLIKDAKLEMPGETFMQSGSRKGIHSEHLGFLLAEMQ